MQKFSCRYCTPPSPVCCTPKGGGTSVFTEFGKFGFPRIGIHEWERRGVPTIVLVARQSTVAGRTFVYRESELETYVRKYRRKS